MQKLKINSIESFSTVDGEGLRSTVFLQGCPLRCIYCHNPDTWSFQGGVQFSPNQLLKNIVKYKSYYGQDGGVTLSGGEPLIQAQGLIKFVSLCRKENINVWLDTAGSIINDDVEKLVELVDAIILDFKFATNDDYRVFANDSLNITLNFLELCQKHNKKIWLRTVIVPKINDTKKFIKSLFLLTKSAKIEKHELLAFHTMGFDKYKLHNLENKLKDTMALDNDKLEKLQTYLNSLRSRQK